MGRQDDENQRRKPPRPRTPAGPVKKTGAGEKGKVKTYAAGSNVLDREKRGTYDEQIAGGTRADDPRNWEFHYKPGYGGGGKDSTRAERAARSRSRGMATAKRAAAQSGKQIYDIKKLEYETVGIQQKTAQSKLDRKAGGGSRGTSKAAQNVTAQKQMAERRRGRGSAQRGAGPFDDTKTKSRSRIA